MKNFETPTPNKPPKEEAENQIPPQYKGLPSEVVEKLWQKKIYTDPKKTEAEARRRENALQQIRDQEKANKIREELGIPTQEINSEKTLDSLQEEAKPLTTKEVEEIKRNAYAKVKQGEGNFDLMINTVDWEVGQRFDAHGLAKESVPAQLRQLLDLIEKGIDPDKPFHTAPLEINPNKKAAMGAGLGTAGGTAYKDGSFIILGEIDRKIQQSGIKYIAVNDAYYDSIPRLQEAYPQVQFIRADKLNETLKEIAEKNSPK